MQARAHSARITRPKRGEPRSQSSARAEASITLDASDLDALLAVIGAGTLSDLDRKSARLRSLLGSQAEVLEPHLAALRANVGELNRLRHLAATDALTNLVNRRAFTDALRRELARVTRSGARLALVMFDIDDFKSINDTLGHAAGDDVLRIFARCATARTRKGDLLGRMGGDEFLLMLPETDVAHAHAIAERIRADFAAAAAQRSMTVGVSVGIASSTSAASAPGVIAEADRAMYRDKAARHVGRGGSAHHLRAGTMDAAARAC
jgi:diguanylate cyclase (GGDEF)-like protein